MRIGIDVVITSRFAKKTMAFFKKYFTEKEIAYAKKKPDFTSSIAGLFAAKEAFLKAVGVGVFKGIKLSEVEIDHTIGGKPVLKLSKEVKKQYKIKKCDVSISHDKDITSAVCVLN